ncbi:hypothetical protein [Pseudomonas sp.]|uniref:antitoxin VbhA family protein n=1 Tax=Pseudomonas sp. TaxID=306 RepID=UPI003D700EF2
MQIAEHEHEHERRRKAVAEVLGCRALEGGRPSSTHLLALQRYVDGLVSLDELSAELIERVRQSSQGWADTSQESQF